MLCADQAGDDPGVQNWRIKAAQLMTKLKQGFCNSSLPYPTPPIENFKEDVTFHYNKVLRNLQVITTKDTD